MEGIWITSVWRGFWVFFAWGHTLGKWAWRIQLWWCIKWRERSDWVVGAKRANRTRWVCFDFNEWSNLHSVSHCDCGWDCFEGSGLSFVYESFLWSFPHILFCPSRGSFWAEPHQWYSPCWLFKSCWTSWSFLQTLARSEWFSCYAGTEA